MSWIGSVLVTVGNFCFVTYAYSENLLTKKKIMKQIKPTLFNKVNANELPNAKQLFYGKVLDAVIALRFFYECQFTALELCRTNYLLKWCVGVLIAHEFKFFQRDADTKHDRQINNLKMNFG